MTPLRRRLVIAGAVLVALVLVGLGVLAYLWTQATALPDWYTAGNASEYAGPPELGSDVPGGPSQWIAFDEQGNRLPDPEPAPGVFFTWPSDSAFDPAATPEAMPRRSYDSTEAPVAPPPRASRPRTGPKPDRYEMRGFHRHAREPSPAVRASRAVYEDGRLEIGVILDLQQLPVERLGPRDRARYERAIASFPGIMERDIWVGVEDEPLRVEGYLALSPDAEVRVGKLTYSLESAAKRLGMTPLELRLEVNRGLRRLGFADPDA
jgi:hypothetical protein